MCNLLGKPLDDYTPMQAFQATQHPEHVIRDGHLLAGLTRNRDLLAVFGKRKILTDAAFVERSRALRRKLRWWRCSDELIAFQAGETIRWSLEEGLVARITYRGEPAWRLLIPEMVYESIGKVPNYPYAVRVRHLPTPEQQKDADKLWAREQRRRERLRVKRVEESKLGAVRALAALRDHGPYRKLPPDMSRFMIHGQEAIVSVADLILAEFDGDISGQAALTLRIALQREASAARRDTERTKAAQLPPEDFAALRDLTV